MKHLKSFIIFLFLFLFYLSQAQDRKEIDSLISVAQKTEIDSIKIVSYHTISKKFTPVSFDSAHYYAQKSLDLAKGAKDTELIIESYIRLAWVFDDNNNIKRAIDYYNKALELAEKEKSISKLIRIYNHIGIAYFNIANYDKSIENLYKSLENAEKTKDSIRISNSYNNIGYIFERQKKYDKALDFYKKSLKIREKLQATHLFPALYNIASTSFRNNDFESGEKYLLRALAISKQNKDTTSIAISCSYLSITYANNKQFQKSKTYLQKTLKLIPFVKNQYQLGQIYYDLGAVYAKLGNYAKAEAFYKKSIEINKKVRVEYLEQSYKELSDLYKKQHKYQQALDYTNKYYQLKDSIYSIEKDKAVSEVESRYESEKKEQKIVLLQSNIKQQKTKERFLLMITILVFLLALLSIFFFYTYKKRSTELEKKNKIINVALSEKETLIKEVHHRVKNNLQLVSSMLSLQQRYLTNPKAIDAIKDSQNRIDSISLIHQKLYSEQSLTAIKIHDYIEDLIQNIIDLFDIDSNDISFISQIDNLVLDVDTAMPIGLIVNELIINSIKHNREKTNLNIEIQLFKKQEKLHLIVKDDGKGVPENFDFQKSNSYGMKMIASFARKLKANISFKNDNGLQVYIQINKYHELEN